MKKIVTNSTTGGAPIYLDDLKETFNDEIWDVLQGLLSQWDTADEGLIVQGCNVGGSGPSSYTISGGIVYLDGEFRRLAAQTGLSLPIFIKAATDVNTARTFEDTTSKTLFVTKSADIAGSAPMSGQYIEITSIGDSDDRRTPYQVVIPIGDWNMDSTGTVNVAHNLDFDRIVGVASVLIISDDSTVKSSLDIRVDIGGDVQASGSFTISTTDVALSRTPGGSYDSTSYDSTSFNRGHIVLTCI